jgi:hypothetical protein
VKWGKTQGLGCRKNTEERKTEVDDRKQNKQKQREKETNKLKVANRK